ncbi:hypothetical protein Ais01nite_19070 [Asanoa ishikariensis]|uniref:Glycosyl hydrolase family 95 catalytic domain-containing protein n=1 Tax=Asanoa ishikariensis TaxID=137265 RepID=A0A1H3UDQ6_9ACTN|nr:hypothetical protein [Asanoa ishikariensis]GIF63872.1 hypothetical protein Ais01nite_19070 [Asanoa ishikariensis]SDZ59985.1 hypothetical protein SAMN05421684_6967 [Asanoa ishikariensis]
MGKAFTTMAVTVAVTAALGAVAPAARAAPAHQTTSAWRDGALQVDTAGVVSRSDLVLEAPAWRDYQSMPLGNGRLGAAVWAQDGFTAQLNRNDTFPDLKSAGRLVVPGLFDLAAAPNYKGRLNIGDAVLEQSGRGMSARTFVRADRDQLVLEVTGAKPGKEQTADLNLWEGRKPTTYADGKIGALAETFAAGGAVAALTADARDVRATVVDADTVRLTFKPNANGSFRIVVGAPAYTGGDLAAASQKAVAGATDKRVDQAHLSWWHDFWRQAAPMKITSKDGTGEYAEALRAQQLYTTAATQRNTLPTGQAGAANMLYPWQDTPVSPSTWFHFNLRQQVNANYGAGTASFNAPYLNLYTSHLAQMKAWTQAHWAGADGTCVPELIRYDGTPDGCVNGQAPTWTNAILTGGLEVSHDLWRQYEFTQDPKVLDQGYPLMSEVARFYLSQLKEGTDGKLHLEHVNSFETQWDAADPTPDLAGMRVMFPVIADLAADRGDADLAGKLRAALTKLPNLPTTTRNGKQVYAWSATNEPAKNTQNTDLEPLAPWGLTGPDDAVMQDTFAQRGFPLTREWDESPVWAADLGRADDMRRLIVQGTADLQKYPNGFSGHGRNDDPASIHNLYSSWNAVVANALQDALVQSNGGTVRVASAIPAGWTVEGSALIAGGHRISTQVSGGEPNEVGIQAGSTDTIRIQNPWPGKAIEVVDGRGKAVVRSTRSDTVDVNVSAGKSYTLKRVDRDFRFDRIEGRPAGAVKRLGTQTLGVAATAPQIQDANVSVAAPDKLHALVAARPGVAAYVDRSDQVTSLPKELTGTTMVRGANGDASRNTPAAYLSVDLAKPAPVYVAFDQRGEGTWWPSWLQEQGFTRTDLTVGKHEFARKFEIVDGGRLRASGGGATLSRVGAGWGDQVIEAKVRQIQVGASVMFRATDASNGYVWNIGGPLGSAGGLGQLRMSTVVNGKSTLIGSVIPIGPGAGNEYTLRIEAIGNHLRTFVDGKLVDDRIDNTFAGGRVGVNLGGSDVGEYDRITVSSPDGATLFKDEFSGDLAQWDIPATRQDVPLVVFKKDAPAGRLLLGPNTGISGRGDSSYLTFIGKPGQ